MPMTGLEGLTERFNTVGAFWHDAYCQWQVVADGQRRTFEDCRLDGWGDSLDEAVADVVARSVRPEGANP